MPRPTNPPTRIRSQKDLADLISYVTALDPNLARAHELAGPPFYRKRKAGFESLLKMVVEQQLSRASADAIWARLTSATPEVSPGAILRLGDKQMRAAGMSGPKMRYARCLADAVESGQLRLDRLARQGDDEVMERLCSVTGIGRWTAEIYMLFCLGRANVWPAGDIAVQAALQLVLDLEARPQPKHMDELGAQWHPARGVAALILWQYYRHVKNRPVWV